MRDQSKQKRGLLARLAPALALSALGALMTGCAGVAPPATPSASSGVIPFNTPASIIALPGSEWVMTSNSPRELRALIGEVGLGFNSIPELIEALSARAPSIGQRLVKTRFERKGKLVTLTLMPASADPERAFASNEVRLGTWTYVANPAAAQVAGGDIALAADANWDGHYAYRGELQARVLKSMARNFGEGNDLNNARVVRQMVEQTKALYCSSSLLWTSDIGSHRVEWRILFDDRCVASSGMLGLLDQEELDEAEAATRRPGGPQPRRLFVEKLSAPTQPRR